MRSGGAAITSGDGLGFVDWKYAPARRKLPSVTRELLEKVVDESDAVTVADPDVIDVLLDSLTNALDTADVMEIPDGVDTAVQTTQMLPTDLLPLR